MSTQEVTRKRHLEEEEEQQGQFNNADTSTPDVKNENSHLSKKARSGEKIVGDATTTATVVNSATTTASSSADGSSGENKPSANESRQQQPARQQSQPQRPPRNDHAFFGTDVMDDVVRTIGEFLYEHCHHANVEIEAKLGVLIDKNTGRRIDLPVRSEVVLVPQGRPPWYQFSSDMTLAQHAHFNKTLNWRLEQTRRTEPPERQIRYQHTHEIDQLYTTPNGKTRVTVDQKTNKIIPNGIIKKDRIADLDVFSPRNPFDFRISVNVEVPVPAPQGVSHLERHKDRISYRHNNFKIDLTQVKTVNSANGHNRNQPHNYSQMRPTNFNPNKINNNPDMTHELEIEFVHPEELARQREIRINSNGRQPDRFMEIVGHFVNNVRGLAVRGNIQQPPPPSSQQQQQQQQ
ncbi:mRNA-capping enzyme subunit beta [Lobosporangium transversale]|uniref:mRNA-capping enzyme subunit beta n=1 Tax=Lobosporangium transversale TaxID=64571 RepID=A0A1Y2GX78_9FUNG|nr:CYTH-like domain-containing protein [Lobosporangium transversale]KAF9900929.1 mRNA-capping enzyme subunit beta [Lobosporangium transversale]ORZ26424.1 CYTH-like domain-containing protein [Lobosporangium transversale]|eukprot:XP_021884189.1 CYTH-like domain-containing protein [Lobosporangium transversale]